MPIKGLRTSDLIIFFLGLLLMLIGLFGITLLPLATVPLEEEAKPVEIKPSIYLAVIGCLILLFLGIRLFLRARKLT